MKVGMVDDGARGLRSAAEVTEQSGEEVRDAFAMLCEGPRGIRRASCRCERRRRLVRDGASDAVWNREIGSGKLPQLCNRSTGGRPSALALPFIFLLYKTSSAKSKSSLSLQNLYP